MKYLVLLIIVPLLNISATNVESVNKQHSKYNTLYGEPLKIGSLIPKANVKLENCGGAIVRLKRAGMENGMLVMFTSNTCVSVLENQLRIMDIANYSLKNKVGVIMVNANEKDRDGTESKAAMNAYAQELGFKWLYVIDKNSRVAEAFGATRTPECFLFDPLGKLVYKGSIDDCPKDEKEVTHQYLKDAITSAAAGKTINIKQTDPTGCTIKRK